MSVIARLADEFFDGDDDAVEAYLDRYGPQYDAAKQDNPQLSLYEFVKSKITASPEIVEEAKAVAEERRTEISSDGDSDDDEGNERGDLSEAAKLALKARVKVMFEQAKLEQTFPPSDQARLADLMRKMHSMKMAPTRMMKHSSIDYEPGDGEFSDRAGFFKSVKNAFNKVKAGVKAGVTGVKNGVKSAKESYKSSASRDGEFEPEYFEESEFSPKESAYELADHSQRDKCYSKRGDGYDDRPAIDSVESPDEKKFKDLLYGRSSGYSGGGGKSKMPSEEEVAAALYGRSSGYGKPESLSADEISSLLYGTRGPSYSVLQADSAYDTVTRSSNRNRLIDEISAIDASGLVDLAKKLTSDRGLELLVGKEVASMKKKLEFASEIDFEATGIPEPLVKFLLTRAVPEGGALRSRPRKTPANVSLTVHTPAGVVSLASISAPSPAGDDVRNDVFTFSTNAGPKTAVITNYKIEGHIPVEALVGDGGRTPFPIKYVIDIPYGEYASDLFKFKSYLKMPVGGALGKPDVRLGWAVLDSHEKISAHLVFQVANDRSLSNIYAIMLYDSEEPSLDEEEDFLAKLAKRMETESRALKAISASTGDQYIKDPSVISARQALFNDGTATATRSRTGLFNSALRKVGRLFSQKSVSLRFEAYALGNKNTAPNVPSELVEFFDMSLADAMFDPAHSDPASWLTSIETAPLSMRNYKASLRNEGEYPIKDGQIRAYSSRTGSVSVISAKPISARSGVMEFESTSADAGTMRAPRVSYKVDAIKIDPVMPASVFSIAGGQQSPVELDIGNTVLVGALSEKLNKRDAFPFKTRAFKLIIESAAAREALASGASGVFTATAPAKSLGGRGDMPITVVLSYDTSVFNGVWFLYKL